MIFKKQKKLLQKLTMTLFAGAVSLMFFSALLVPATGLHAATSDQLSAQLQLKNPLDSTSDVPAILKNILSGLILILTPFLVIMLIYTGFLFVSAQGNAEKLGEAKKMFMYTLIGAAIVLGAQGLSDIVSHTIGCIAGSGANC